MCNFDQKKNPHLVRRGHASEQALQFDVDSIPIELYKYLLKMQENTWKRIDFVYKYTINYITY